ncbi:arrestin domain-containing protein 4 isoform X1 [Pygocentrus nattereri]|uniref:Arrestin C-terminal-like domain-containing protein n=2 Tax=Pygocentrus nattereri TaxID=42514 RepID=A0AAR2J609_PYGNA|nr:arrestin domain-containing protein 4 isoform X1 [Pygocentrus nattereri]
MNPEMADKVKMLGLLFDNDQGSGYSPGEVVSGHVLIDLSTPTIIRAIRLLATGCCRVGWIEGSRSQPACALNIVPSPFLSRCCEEREYLCLSKTLLEATGNEGLSLEVGRHEIPFELELPQRPLVPSFTGKHGGVCYSVKAVLQRPLHHDQHVCRELLIISHVDVNSPELVCPVAESNEKMIGCWIFASGPVSLNVNIERKGYSKGESIPIHAEIENCSSRLVMPKAVIYQIQTYKARGKTIRYKHVVASVRGNHIPSGCAITWNGKTLKIPSVSPSILNSDILRVEYSLAVIVQIPGAKKLKVELPVVIGTTSYSGFGSRSLHVISGFSAGWLPFTLPDTPEAPPNYADVVSEEEFDQHHPTFSPSQQSDELERQLSSQVFAYIQQFHLQPPPLYSEVDPNPVQQQSVFCL